MATTVTVTAASPQIIPAPAVAPAPKGNASMAMLASGGYEAPGMPKIEDPYKKRQWQLEHMAGAFRVFSRKGFTEGTAGHISVRDPVDTNTFWINPCVARHRRRSDPHRVLTQPPGSECTLAC